MRAVIALGGNAFLDQSEKFNFENHLKNIRKVSLEIAKISKKAKICVTHGNAPEVGHFEIIDPDFPLDVHVAETQGMLGYLLQREISRNSKIPAATILTQVLVSPKDKAFKNPTKPIGPYYKRKPNFKNFIKTKLGYRKVVPSPRPIEILESEVIKKLFGEVILIACGGGGIPVIRKGDKIVGVEAVIDKDLASEKLAELIGADSFLILTNVDHVYLNFGTKMQEEIRKASLEEIEKLYNKGEFEKGSMAPKILACIKFLKHGGKRAIIGNLRNAEKVFKGKEGTIIRGF